MLVFCALQLFFWRRLPRLLLLNVNAQAPELLENNRKVVQLLVIFSIFIDLQFLRVGGRLRLARLGIGRLGESE